MERNLTLIALFAALTAALGLVPKIDLMSGVPITAQSLGIMLCGTVLGKRDGALAVLLFLLLAAVGLPILSGGRGGLGVFFGPTAGFLIGFPFAAFVAGWIVEKWSAPIGLAAFAGAIIGGIIVLYVFGAIGMAIALDKSFIEASPFLASFLPENVIKAVLAGLVTAAFVAGWIVEKWSAPISLAAFAGAVIGGIIVVYVSYLFGTIDMAVTLSKSTIEVSLLLAPFLPGDIIKAVLAGLITAALYGMRPGVILSRPND